MATVCFPWLTDCMHSISGSCPTVDSLCVCYKNTVIYRRPPVSRMGHAPLLQCQGRLSLLPSMSVKWYQFLDLVLVNGNDGCRWQQPAIPASVDLVTTIVDLAVVYCFFMLWCLYVCAGKTSIWSIPLGAVAALVFIIVLIAVIAVRHFCFLFMH